MTEETLCCWSRHWLFMTKSDSLWWELMRVSFETVKGCLQQHLSLRDTLAVRQKHMKFKQKDILCVPMCLRKSHQMTKSFSVHNTRDSLGQMSSHNIDTWAETCSLIMLKQYHTTIPQHTKHHGVEWNEKRWGLGGWNNYIDIIVRFLAEAEYWMSSRRRKTCWPN